MAMPQFYPLPKLYRLPASMPSDGSINITLEEGVPVFRASAAVQQRIQTLLEKQHTHEITASEAEELNRYEDIDDYLSHLNRVVRNLLQAPNELSCRVVSCLHPSNNVYAGGPTTCANTATQRSSGSTFCLVQRLSPHHRRYPNRSGNGSCITPESRTCNSYPRG